MNDQNYNDIQVNNECLKILSLPFIKKYHCVAYGYYHDDLLLLVNDNFSFYNLNKISFFTDKNIKIIYAKMEEWEKVVELISLEQQKTKAIYKYQINNDDKENVVLNENKNVFYNVEINNSPIVKIVDSIIKEAITLKASDIHIEPMEECVKVRVRVDGKLIEKSMLPISSISEVSSRIKVLSNLDITKKLIPQDGKFRFSFNDVNYDIRVSIIPSIYGERIALRILDLKNKMYSVEELGLNEISYQNVLKLLETSSGLILVTGPTGSGKSTTLQSFLRKNSLKNENIITVEDPVEYTIPHITQVQINEESGLDFATCLKTILRHDPNIIMIGEIRDLETAKIACRASITGHLVYSTLHTNTSFGVISRLKDMEIDNYLLIDALKGVISQRLIRCLCDNCKKQSKILLSEAKYLDVSEDTLIYRPSGCPKCNMTGYVGRRGIYEVIIFDDELKKFIIDNSNSVKFYKLIAKKNFQTLFENGKELILEGITSVEELQSVLN